MMGILKKMMSNMKLSKFELNIECKEIIEALNTKQSSSRFVGGFVRNYINNTNTKDIDIATQLSPDEVIDVLSKIKIKAIPTGIKHGTVTAFINDQSFEITTLRKEVRHDGRHSEVIFIDDWYEDASRRDFTINSIYIDQNGEIYDPFNGIEHLNDKRIIFIGEPEKRINEDYLRILRYYRFLAIYNSPAEKKTRQVIKENAEKITKLSRERIHEEFFKILENDNTGKIINLMYEDGILDILFSASVDICTFNRMKDIDDELFFDKNTLLRFTSLIPEKEDNIENLKNFSFSNKEKKLLKFLTDKNNEIKSYQSAKETRVFLYKNGIQNFNDITRLYWAKDKKISNISQWRALLAMGQSWKVPTFPVESRDLFLLGVPEGPLIGEILREVEDWWIESDFINDKPSLFERIKAIVGAKI